MFEEVAEGAKRIAGRVVVGGALGIAALAPLPADAQQVAANTPAAASAWPATVEECKKIQDLARSTQCIVEVGNRNNLRATEVANQRGDCADQVVAGINSGAFSREKLKTILAGRPAKEVGACNILAQLKS